MLPPPGPATEPFGEEGETDSESEEEEGEEEQETVLEPVNCSLGHFIKAEKWKLKMRSLVLCADFIYKLMLQNVFYHVTGPPTVNHPPL